MITEDKVIEIFCIMDEFCNKFASECEKNLLLEDRITLTATVKDG